METRVATFPNLATCLCGAAVAPRAWWSDSAQTAQAGRLARSEYNQRICCALLAIYAVLVRHELTGAARFTPLERAPNIGAPQHRQRSCKIWRLARSDCIQRVRSSSFNTPTAVVRNQQVAINANPKTVGIDLSKNLPQQIFLEFDAKSGRSGLECSSERPKRTLSNATPSPARIFHPRPFYTGLTLTRLDETVAHPDQISPARGRGTILGQLH